jgi:glyoxylase-like metal-dependent hydrolase (beta-lactamase superfamily II)
MMDIQATWLGIPTPTVSNPDDTLDDGKLIAIGASPELSQKGLTGSILHTPGHTEGSVCLYLPDQTLLLAGDTLFAGSVGRTDLPGGNTSKLLHSIHERLLTLPDEVTVIPGHGPRTTIGSERASNPFLQHK